MASEAFIQCRVPQATKAALRAAAQRQQLSESAVLKRMLDVLLHASGEANTSVTISDRPARQARLYVRLTLGDRQLLQARSAARCLAPATYASVLLRAHLRALTPLPEAELNAIRDSTRELGAIGRSLNQIARAMHHGAPGAEVSQRTLLTFLKVCQALRDNVHAYARTNQSSWESGDASSQSCSR